MGNHPSSHPHHQQHHHHQQQQQQQQHHPPSSNQIPSLNHPPTSSAPPTPTGAHHLNHPSSPLNPHLLSLASASYAPASAACSPSSSSSSSSSPFSPSSLNLPPPTSTFVDGGYLFPISNIYPSSTQDWLHPIVQHLILYRRLAPFYRGLEDWEPDWDRQIISHSLHSIHLSRIQSIQQTLKLERQPSSTPSNHHPKASSTAASIGKRFTKNLLDHPSLLHPHQSPLPSSPDHPHPSSTARQQIFEAVLNAQVRPNEIDRYLHRTVECPICFLYYPPNINLSRCCQQPICTECFTQIKRIDPTPQEMKSEPACCPYCVESNFGVTYEPPPADQRTDWTHLPSVTARPVTTTISVPAVLLPTSSQQAQPTISSQSAPSPSMIASSLDSDPTDSLHPTPETVSPKMKRRQTTSHTSKEVVTTDSIQPDWQVKLEAVKAVVQRRANRRIIFRQEGDRLIPVGITSSRDPSGGSAFLAAFEQDHSASSNATRRGLSSLIGGSGHLTAHHSTTTSPPGGSVRRHRTENPSYGVDLEELMIMEAMRLSLAEEEDRKRKAAEEEERLKRITEALADESQGPSTSTDPGARRTTINHQAVDQPSLQRSIPPITSAHHPSHSELITPGRTDSSSRFDHPLSTPGSSNPTDRVSSSSSLPHLHPSNPFGAAILAQNFQSTIHPTNTSICGSPQSISILENADRSTIRPDRQPIEANRDPSTLTHTLSSFNSSPHSINPIQAHHRASSSPLPLINPSAAPIEIERSRQDRSEEGHERGAGRLEVELDPQSSCRPDRHQLTDGLNRPTIHSRASDPSRTDESPHSTDQTL